MPENPYLQLLRREIADWRAMLATLERGDIFVGDDRFNEARLEFTRRHVAHLATAIEAEEARIA